MAKTPQNTNNEDSDFLFQQKVYIGLDDNQFEVRDRFNTVEQSIATLSETISTNEHGDITIIIPPSDPSDPEELPTEVNITEHVNNALIHVPAGGDPNQVFTAQNGGLRVWKNIESILPAILRSIVETGVTVSPDQVVSAFRQITVSSWSAAGQPMGNHKIKAIAHDSARFIVGNNNGYVVTGNPNAWNPQRQLFNDPVESITTFITPSAQKVAVILDAFSDFYILLEGNFSKRLSVRVTEVTLPDPTPENPNQTKIGYTDRYETADFVAALSGNGIVILATTKGTVYRASYADVIAEYNRSLQTSDYDRHSIIWQMQETQESITSNVLCGAVGGGFYLLGGVLGKMAISTDGSNWTNINNNSITNNINSIAAGNDRWLAVGDNGLVAFALFNSPENWTKVTSPFGIAARVMTVTFGSGLFILTDEFSNVKYTRDGTEYYDVPADLIGYGSASGFGDTYFLIGDEYGYLRQSLSVAALLSVVSQGQFTDLSNRVWAEYDIFLQRWNNYISGEDYTGSPFVMLQQLARPSETIDDDGNIERQSHTTGIPILGSDGVILEEFTRRGMSNGLAPLNENTKVPSDYLDIYDMNTLLRSLRNEMTKIWHLLPVTLFSDLVGFSRINDIAYNDTTIIVVGERGRIASGSKIRSIAMRESPFDTDESVVGVVIGNDNYDNTLVIAISQSRWSYSIDNGNYWSSAVELSANLQVIDFCGGLFLIADAQGKIFRSVWTLDGLQFTAQESEILTTQGVKAFAFFEGKYYGVGTYNKIVSSPDAIYWTAEQSPTAYMTNYNSVTAVTDRIIAVGNNGIIVYKKSNSSVWTLAVSGTLADLYSVIYAFDLIIASGSDGTVTTSFEGDVFESTNIGTNAILRAVAFQKQFIVGSDLGQFYGSLSLADVIGLFDDLSAYSGLPKALAALADTGEEVQYSRGDHVHPDTGLLLESNVGKPTSYKTIYEVVPNPDYDPNDPDSLEYITTETQVVDRYGVPPLGQDAIVPKEFLPPIDIEQLVNALQYTFDFMQIEPSPFEAGNPNNSVVLAGADLGNRGILVGDLGIAVSENIREWNIIETSLDRTPIDSVIAFKSSGAPIIIVITNNQCLYTPNIDDPEEYIVREFSSSTVDFSSVDYYQGKVVITSISGEVYIADPDDMIFDLQSSATETTAGIVRTVGGSGYWIAVGLGGKIWTSADARHFLPVDASDRPTEAPLIMLAAGKGIFIAGGSEGTVIAKIGGGSWKVVSIPVVNTTANITAIEYLSNVGAFVIANQSGELVVAYGDQDAEGNLIFQKIDSPSQHPIRSISTAFGNLVIANDIGEIFTAKLYFGIGSGGYIGGGGCGTGTGTIGAPGEAATITIGTTTTLEAGSDATVINTGTATAAILNFGIPRGADGQDGEDGSSSGSGGTTNYNDLTNKPSINNTTLVGNITIDTEKYIAGNNVTITDGTGNNVGKRVINATSGGGGSSDGSGGEVIVQVDKNLVWDSATQESSIEYFDLELNGQIVKDAGFVIKNERRKIEYSGTNQPQHDYLNISIRPSSLDEIPVQKNGLDNEQNTSDGLLLQSYVERPGASSPSIVSNPAYLFLGNNAIRLMLHSDETKYNGLLMNGNNIQLRSGGDMHLLMDGNTFIIASHDGNVSSLTIPYPEISKSIQISETSAYLASSQVLSANREGNIVNSYSGTSARSASMSVRIGDLEPEDNYNRRTAASVRVTVGDYRMEFPDESVIYVPTASVALSGHTVSLDANIVDDNNVVHKKYVDNKYTAGGGILIEFGDKNIISINLVGGEGIDVNEAKDSNGNLTGGLEISSLYTYGSGLKTAPEKDQNGQLTGKTVVSTVYTAGEGISFEKEIDPETNLETGNIAISADRDDGGGSWKITATDPGVGSALASGKVLFVYDA
jgi:hypothetical protein